MSANFIVNTLSAREYFAAQLRVLAEDTATSLAFSFSHAAKNNDQAQQQVHVLNNHNHFVLLVYYCHHLLMQNLYQVKT